MRVLYHAHLSLSFVSLNLNHYFSLLTLVAKQIIEHLDKHQYPTCATHEKCVCSGRCCLHLVTSFSSHDVKATHKILHRIQDSALCGTTRNISLKWQEMSKCKVKGRAFQRSLCRSESRIRAGITLCNNMILICFVSVKLDRHNISWLTY